MPPTLMPLMLLKMILLILTPCKIAKTIKLKLLPTLMTPTIIPPVLLMMMLPPLTLVSYIPLLNVKLTPSQCLK